MPTIRQLHRIWESQFEFFTRDKDFNLIPRKAMTENKEILPLTERASIYARGISENDTYQSYLVNAFTEGAKQEKEIWTEEVKKAFIAGFDFASDESKPSKEEYMEQLKKTL